MPGQTPQNKERIDMIKETKLSAVGLRIDSIPAKRRRFTGPGGTAAKNPPVRICRGNQVIGKWSVTEIKVRLESEDLLPTDSFYDENVSDWLPLSELQIRQTAVQVEKTVLRPCYCGTGLPFLVCCGGGGDS